MLANAQKNYILHDTLIILINHEIASWKTVYKSSCSCFVVLMTVIQFMARHETHGFVALAAIVGSLLPLPSQSMSVTTHNAVWLIVSLLKLPNEVPLSQPGRERIDARSSNLL